METRAFKYCLFHVFANVLVLTRPTQFRMRLSRCVGWVERSSMESLTRKKGFRGLIPAESAEIRVKPNIHRTKSTIINSPIFPLRWNPLFNSWVSLYLCTPPAYRKAEYNLIVVLLNPTYTATIMEQHRRGIYITQGTPSHSLIAHLIQFGCLIPYNQIRFSC